MSREERKTLDALRELIREGYITPNQAIAEFRNEFKYSLSYCINFGIVKYLGYESK